MNFARTTIVEYRIRTRRGDKATTAAGKFGILETSDDPAEIRKARDKAKACGELAAVVRKVATMTGQARSKPARIELSRLTVRLSVLRCMPSRRAARH